MAMDPHFWLSPAEITNTLPALKNQLIILFPEYSETIESNFQQLMQDLQQLDEDLTQQLSPIKGQTILVYHPTLGYFCSSYGLEQVALETQGKEPSPRQLEEFIYTAQQKKIELILVQPQYSGQSAEVIAQAIHGRVESFNQLAYNWEENLRALADMLTSP
jgi:zinc transport system substrate-binding protein